MAADQTQQPQAAQQTSSAAARISAALIIPFSFDGKGGLAAAERALPSVWRRRTDAMPELYSHIGSMTHAKKGQDSIGACFTATARELIPAVLPSAGGGYFAACQRSTPPEKAFSHESEYFSLGDSSLWLFETGVGFLCLECTAANTATLNRIKTIYGNKVTCFCKKKNSETAEAFEMSAFPEKLLRGLPECQTFFSLTGRSTFAQAITFTRRQLDPGTDDEAAKEEAFRLLMIHSESALADSASHSREEYFVPFSGAHWAISTRGFGVTCSTQGFAKQYMGRMPALYTTVIILALHQKFAILRFTGKLGCTGRELVRLRESMLDFQTRCVFGTISDNPNVQRIYELIMETNGIDRMLAELDEKLETMTDREQSRHRVVLERTTGILTTAFSLMSVVSILNDGTDFIASHTPPALHGVLTGGLAVLAAACAAAAVYGIVAVTRHTK